MFLLYITTVIFFHASYIESHLLSEHHRCAGKSKPCVPSVTDASSARSKSAILHKCVSRRPLRLLGLIKQSEEGMSTRGLAPKHRPVPLSHQLEEDECRSGRYSVWKAFKMAKHCIISPSSAVSAGQRGATG